LRLRHRHRHCHGSSGYQWGKFQYFATSTMKYMPDDEFNNNEKRKEEISSIYYCHIENMVIAGLVIPLFVRSHTVRCVAQALTLSRSWTETQCHGQPTTCGYDHALPFSHYYTAYAQTPCVTPVPILKQFR
jgi:hypothetical protein